MRFLLGLVPAVVLVAQTQPIPGQFPPTPIEPIPNPYSGPPMERSATTSSFAVLLDKVEPGYTAEAKAAGLQGRVSLYVEVDGDGKPSTIHVMEGLGLGLDEEAVKAVGQWRFQPRPGAPNNIQDILEVEVNWFGRPGTWFVASEHYDFPASVREQHWDIDRPVPTRYVAPAVECSEPETVSIPFIVGKDGIATAAEAVEDRAIAKALESWKFKPARAEGEALDAMGTVEFECRTAVETPKPLWEPLAGPRTPPVLIHNTEPQYSEEARRAKLQGVSTLHIEVSPEGKPTRIHVIGPLGMGLDQKAMEAVMHWRFKPGMKGGHPVTTEATIAVNFRLL
jgi:TonB family protein